jgi:protein-disulfide isomerase
MPRLTKPVDPARDHIQGPDDAPVTLVEYGDFQCPHCGRAYPILKSIQKTMGDQLRFVYRHFPISEDHENAIPAAEASEAAAAQGKFWEMHDLLFEHQNRLDDKSLLGYARQLGLDLDRFTQDMREHTYGERVKEDFSSGLRSGANGTPTFFINGDRYDLPWEPEPWLLRALQEAQVA